MIIWRDFDDAGRDYAAQLAAKLEALPITTPLILTITDAPIKAQDGSDVLPSYLPKGWDSKNPQGEPYATLRGKGHFENWANGSKTFRDYLAYQHYKSEGKAPSNAALDDKRRMLEGVAKFEGETRPMFSRIASIGRTLDLDLGDANWQVAAITFEG